MSASERSPGTQSRRGWAPAGPLRHPVLFVNPASGGGKARRAGVADQARERGIEVVVLSPDHSLTALVRDAVARGADALGVAGGDGSLAIAAAAAVANGLPLVCIPAGTRNHFALDLGVDRHDLVGALDAFTDGVERRIDVAEVNGRVFVNNVSLGIYGDAVQRPGYREEKVRALLETAQTVLGPSGAAPELHLVDDLGREHSHPAVVLVSNNPYALDLPLAPAPARPSVAVGSGSSFSTHHTRLERHGCRDRCPRACPRRGRRGGRRPEPAARVRDPARGAARQDLVPPSWRVAFRTARHAAWSSPTARERSSAPLDIIEAGATYVCAVAGQFVGVGSRQRRIDDGVLRHVEAVRRQRGRGRRVLLRQVGGALRPLGLALGLSTHVRGLHRLDLARDRRGRVVPPLQSGGTGITNGSLELVDGGLERSLDLTPPLLEQGPIGFQRRGGRVLERLDLSRKVFERLRQELHSVASPCCHQP